MITPFRQFRARVRVPVSTVAAALVFAATPLAAQTATQDPAPPATWLTQPELLGNWGGARTKLGEKGTRIDASFTQFFDWVPVGDDERGFDYGGKFDIKTRSDFSQYGWKGFSIDAHVELRFGDVPLLSGGTFIPTSTALLFPDSSGTAAQISALFGTKVFDNKYVLQFGRFNTLDLYSAHPFTGASGIDRFMNLSLVAPPVSGRTVPPVAEGVLFTVLRGPAPALTVGLIESTEGGFFDNGATFMWSYSLPVKLSEKPGGIGIGGEISSFTGTSLDQSPWAIIPIFDIPLEQKQGTWTLNATVDQFVWMHPNDPTKGMGVFGMFGVSDSNPSFLNIQSFIGFGGAAPFEGRSGDNWGAAYFYNGISGDLEETLEPFLRTRDEQGIELFYTYAPVKWSRISADLQLIDPTSVRAETRLFFALRWKVIF
jgi:porin